MEMPAWLITLAGTPEFALLSFFFGAFGTILTVFGTVLTIKGWQAHKRAEDKWGYLFRLAGQNIKKDLTDEELANAQKELEKRLEERAVIEAEMPKQAQRIALKDRLKGNVSRLHETLQSTLEIQAELKRLGDPPDLASDFLSSVQDAISPDFAKDIRQRNLKTYLTFSAVVMAISSIIIPDPFQLIITATFAAICILIIVAILRDQGPIKIDTSHLLILQASAWGLAIGSIASLLLAWVFFGEWRSQHMIYDGWINPGDPGHVESLLIWFNLSAGVLVGAIAVWILYKSLLSRVVSIFLFLSGGMGILLWVLTAANGSGKFTEPLITTAFALFELACLSAALAGLAFFVVDRVKEDRRQGGSSPSRTGA